MEYRKTQRADPNLEKAARRNELEVDIAEVGKENLASGRIFKDIFLAADLYGVFEDLFGTDIMFSPSKDIQIQYDFDDEYVTPVYRGTNIHFTRIIVLSWIIDFILCVCAMIYLSKTVWYIYTGNVIKPKEAVSQPIVSFDTTEDQDCFWTLVID